MHQYKKLPDMHHTIFVTGPGTSRPGILTIYSLYYATKQQKIGGGNLFERDSHKLTNFELRDLEYRLCRNVDKHKMINMALPPREEYADVVIDTIEQYAPGFRLA